MVFKRYSIYKILKYCYNGQIKRGWIRKGEDMRKLKYKILGVCSLFIFLLLGCGASGVKTEKVLGDLADGIENRWRKGYSIADETPQLERIEIYNNLIVEELMFIEKYEESEFQDEELGIMIKKYIGAMQTARSAYEHKEDLMQYTTLLYQGVEAASVYLQDIAEKYQLLDYVDEEYQMNVKNLVYIESEEIEEKSDAESLQETTGSELSYDLYTDIEKTLLYSDGEGNIVDCYGTIIPEYSYITILENNVLSDGECILEGVEVSESGQLVFCEVEDIVNSIDKPAGTEMLLLKSGQYKNPDRPIIFTIPASVYSDGENQAFVYVTIYCGVEGDEYANEYTGIINLFDLGTVTVKTGIQSAVYFDYSEGVISGTGLETLANDYYWNHGLETYSGIGTACDYYLLDNVEVYESYGKVDLWNCHSTYMREDGVDITIYPIDEQSFFLAFRDYVSIDIRDIKFELAGDGTEAIYKDSTGAVLNLNISENGDIINISQEGELAYCEGLDFTGTYWGYSETPE